MCDFFPGRLIAATHKNDPAAHRLLSDVREETVEHVSYGGSLIDRLKSMEIQVPESFEWDIHVLNVPEGEELWKMNMLSGFYTNDYADMYLNEYLNHLESRTASDRLQQMQDRIFPKMQLGVDSYLSLPSTVGLMPEHQTYKSMLGIDLSNESGAGVNVAILDTGLDQSCGFSVSSSSRNFTDDADPWTIDDLNGHGSAVASIIKDVAPDCELTILKVGDTNPVSEWNVLSALVAANQADVVNMSLAFSLSSHSCSTCGRAENHSTRSAIFELVLEEMIRCNPDSLAVAAAGNRRLPTLDYPARYDSVVAVGAIDSTGARSTDSNYGATKQGGGVHDLLFFAPGGGNGEYVAHSTIDGAVTQHEGTSFSAPYVTGMLARHLGTTGVSRKRVDVLKHLIKHADTSAISGYTRTEFGNGIIRI